VDNASSGETIFVYNGYYLEEVHVNKSVSLIGQSIVNTIVYGGFNISSNFTVVDSFNIIHGTSWDPDGAGNNGEYFAGILSTSSGNTYLNNVFQNIFGGDGKDTSGTLSRGGDGDMGSGIYLLNSDNNVLTNNEFFQIEGGDGGFADGGPTTGGNGGIACAVYLDTSTYNNITNDDISYLYGGLGGRGNAYQGSYGNGKGGVACGYFLDDSALNYFENDTIESLYGGDGDLGWNGPGGIGGISSGIFLLGSTNNTFNGILVNNIFGGDGGSPSAAGGIGSGAYLELSESNTFESFVITNVSGGTSGGTGGIGCGFYLISSIRNSFDDNTIKFISGGPGGVAQADFGFFIENQCFENNISSNNLFESESIWYYHNVSDLTIENLNLTLNSNPTNFGKISLINCSNCTIRNCTISNFSGSAASEGNPGYLGCGIYILNSSHIAISSNNIMNIRGSTSSGIYFKDSTLNTVLNNTISNITSIKTNACGILINNVTNSEFIYNNITSIKKTIGNIYGIYSISSKVNIFYNNSISSLIQGYGLYLTSSSDLNNIYHNNFFDSFNQSYDDGYNFWDNGYPSGGNYWDDYMGIDADGDGIGDTPYNISGGSNQDLHPLMDSYNPWSVILNFTTPESMSDFVVFGERPGAKDEQDSWDVPKPGFPPKPYVYAWFDANLSTPYTNLWYDYRYYPDVNKTWDLYLLCDTSGPVLGSTNITIAWKTDDVNQSEYAYVKLFEYGNSTPVADMRTVANYTFNATFDALYHFQIVCIRTPFVVSLSEEWSIISVPCYQYIDKTEIIVMNNSIEYSWSEAISEGIILGFLYDYNRTTQSYDLSDSLEPGYGYWVWAYYDCELLIFSNSIGNGHITNLKDDWAIMGSPYNITIPKIDIIIEFNNIFYTWDEAASNEIILGFIYGWSTTNHMYELVDSYAPGRGYWMYAYQPCKLKRDI